MSERMITTRKLDATDNKGERIRAAMTGAEDYEIALPYGLPTELAHEKAARMLAHGALGGDFDIVNSGTTVRGYTFRVTMR